MRTSSSSAAGIRGRLSPEERFDAERLLLPDGAVTPLVVNGHDPTRIGLAVLLRSQGWVSHCLMAEDQRRAIALAARYRPDVALLDISDAGPFAASMTGALRDAHQGIQIVLTSRCAPSPGAPLHRLGAAAFVAPTATSEEIVTTVRAAALSLEPPTPAAGQGTARPEHTLTDRELELLVLIGTGATNREIGRHLHLGPDSIKKHASALYRKLGVRNRTEAARLAAEVLGATG